MRITVIGGIAESLVNFRGELLRTMVARGHNVLAVALEHDDKAAEGLGQMGVSYRHVPADRVAVDPVRGARTIARLARELRAFRPEIVLAYTVKPIVYGLIAARLSGVPRRAALVTGVGSTLLPGAGLRRRALGGVVRALYRTALRTADVVLFQNPDDEALFRDLRLVTDLNRLSRVNGSGVDLVRFAPAPMPPHDTTTFLMIARLLKDKGLQEYVAAARVVRRSHPSTRFQLLGPLDSNPSGISAAELETWRREQVIDYLGATSDVRPFIARSHVCVLPSYAEGMPRVVLESMAMARPVLTTDAPGCRDTVEPGRNGLLVPVRDVDRLAAAMRQFADCSPGELVRMGGNSRRIAEERFDVHAVNRAILNAIGASDDDPARTAASAR